MNSKFAILAVGFTTIMSFTFINIGQSLMMLAKGFTDDLQRGKNIGLLETADILTSMAFMPVYGIVGDKVGRRNVLIFGLLVLAISLLLYPYGTSIHGSSFSDFFSSFLFFRFIFAIGGSAVTCMSSATIGDITKNKDASGLSSTFSFFSGLGGFVGAVALGNSPNLLQKARIPVKTSIAIAFCINACSLVLALLCACRWIPNTRRSSNRPWSKSMTRQLLCAPLIASFLQSFAARIATIIIPVFLAPAILKRRVSTDANYAFRIISSLHHLMFLMSAPLWGIAGKRFGVVKVSMACSIIGALAYTTCYLVSVNDWILGILLCVGAIGGMGMVIAASTQLAEASHDDIQGLASSCFGMVGSLGILFISQTGGLLIDKFALMPFLLTGVVFALALIVLVCLGDARLRQVSPGTIQINITGEE
jgi:DHA1 family multidrug resistance protein-like MFS transporter